MVERIRRFPISTFLPLNFSFLCCNFPSFPLQEVDVYLPDNVDLRGECDEDYSSLSMTFKGFDLKIFFRKVIALETLSKGDKLYSNSIL